MMVTGVNGLLKALAENPMKVWDLIKPERNSFERLKRISIRNKIWFGKLSLKQRRFIELVILAVEKIRSRLLLRLLAPLVLKLLSANGKGNAVKGAIAMMSEGAYKIMREVARRISRIAQKWGNKQAKKWPEDMDFIKYLTVMSLPENKNNFLDGQA